MGKKQKEPKPQTSSFQPWGPTTNQLTRLYGEIPDIGEREYYPGEQVAGFTPYEEQAMTGIADRATAGTPFVPEAQNLMTSTLAGDYLHGGPGFDAALDAAVSKIVPGIQSQYELAGRGQSGMEKAMLAEQIGKQFAGMYGDERNRMTQAMGLAPSVLNLGYADLGMLGEVGAQQRAMEQAGIQAEMAKHAFVEDEPYTKLQRQAGLLQGLAPLAPHTGTATAPGQPQGSRAAGVLGGAASGAAMGSMFGPWGTGIGAVGGGLMGMFG